MELIVWWLIFLALVWIGSSVRRVAERLAELDVTLRKDRTP